MVCWPGSPEEGADQIKAAAIHTPEKINFQWFFETDCCHS
jgi:hypothetical protein